MIQYLPYIASGVSLAASAADFYFSRKRSKLVEEKELALEQKEQSLEQKFSTFESRFAEKPAPKIESAINPGQVNCPDCGHAVTTAFKTKNGQYVCARCQRDEYFTALEEHQNGRPN